MLLIANRLKTPNPDSNFWHATWIYLIKLVKKRKPKSSRVGKHPNYKYHEKNYPFSS
jgi:hypothetical protein